MYAESAGSRWTTHGVMLRKVLPHSGLGNHASGRGESLCRGTETTQPMNYAMIHLDVEVFIGFDETANLPLEQAQTVGSVVQTAHRWGA